MAFRVHGDEVGERLTAHTGRIRRAHGTEDEQLSSTERRMLYSHSEHLPSTCSGCANHLEQIAEPQFPQL